MILLLSWSSKKIGGLVRSMEEEGGFQNLMSKSSLGVKSGEKSQKLCMQL